MLPGGEGGAEAGLSVIRDLAEITGDGFVVARFVTTYDEHRSMLKESTARTVKEFAKPKSIQFHVLIFVLFAILGFIYYTQFEFYGYFRNAELSSAKVVFILTVVPLLLQTIWIRYLGSKVSSNIYEGIASRLPTEEVTVSACEKGLFFESRQCSIFWTYDSLRSIWPHREGIVLVSGALAYYIPDRGFVASFSKSDFLQLLGERAKQVSPDTILKAN